MDVALPTTGTDGGRKLTDMQAAFVDELVSNGGDKIQAAIDAGYSQHTAKAQAYELLAKPHVMQAVMERTMQQLVGMAPKAVQRLNDLTNARSEYVALQASQDILNRIGAKAPERHDVRVAGDITVNIDLG